VRLSSDPAARRRLALLAVGALVALVTGLVVGSGGGDEAEPGGAEPTKAQRELAAVDRLTLRQQVGQLIVSTFPDPRPPAYIRRRLHARETAGVILFAANAATRADWVRLTRAIQRDAGGDALVLVDQEGGEIRSVPWAGPPLSQPLQGTPDQVRTAARTAAGQLNGAGVNVNLAPVADLPGSGVMAGRAFAEDVPARTRAAVEGMRAGGVAATAKHFPGLGQAEVNTDDGSTTSTAELAPFRAAIAAGVPLVMLSHASYPALDARRIASQSPAIVTGLLRKRLGYDGVVITDSLEAQAVLDRSNVAVAAERSIGAGADLILTTGSASWNDVFPRLLARAMSSKPFRERVRRSAARVLELKRSLGLR
jgi:beta-N-acetylhexosaminidase